MKYGIAYYNKFIETGRKKGGKKVIWGRIWNMETGMGGAPRLFDTEEEVIALGEAQVQQYKVLKFDDNGKMIGTLNDYPACFPKDD